MYLRSRCYVKVTLHLHDHAYVYGTCTFNMVSLSHKPIYFVVLTTTKNRMHCIRVFLVYYILYWLQHMGGNYCYTRDAR
jgi:hypothetical protein